MVRSLMDERAGSSTAQRETHSCMPLQVTGQGLSPTLQHSFVNQLLAVWPIHVD